VFTVISFLCCSLAVQAENLIRNDSFERARDGQPRNWSTNTWSGSAEFTIDQNGRTGERCAKISSTEGADAGWMQRIRIEPYGRYRLSGWVKTENIAVTTGRGVQLNTSDGLARTDPLIGTHDWTKLECEFDAADTDSIDINCLFGGWGLATGTAWFDDISVELLEVNRPEPKTVNQTVTIDASQKAEPISELIYGQFIEHMGRCIYGGIWAEMLEDRKFHYPVPAEGDIWGRTGAGARVLRASPWKVIGSADAVTMSTEEPLSGEHEPAITVNGQPAGIYQEELGLVNGKAYVGRIVMAGDRSAGPIQARLIWGDGQKDQQVVTIKRVGRDYKQYPIKFTAGADTDNGRLEIVASGKGTFRIGAVSLMPADNINGFRKDTLALLKELNSPIYRWPGGNFVSGYDWRDGLGERDRRPTRTNPAWTGIETNDVGMHEFVELCRLLDSEPLITVNTGFGDAYSAAAEVEYANGDPKTHYGKQRAQNGHSKPFGVKYWCVGNEMWGNWQLGFMQPHHYVLKHNWVENMMRQVDPDIVTIGSGDLGGGWSENLLKNCADNMDAIAEHFYCQSRGDLTAHVRQVPNRIKEKADGHRRLRESLDELDGKDIRIAMTEWNYWYGPHVFGELGTRYFMKDALGIAAGLHEYFRNSEMYHSAFYAQTVNVIGCIKTTKTNAGFDATGYPLVIYRREFGTIPVEVTGWNERLDVSAALTGDGKYLTIGLVNATIDTYKLNLNFAAAAPTGKAQVWQIAHEDPMAYNEPDQNPAIDIRSLPAADLTEAVTIAPVSITLFKVPVK
jgi:alpha-N-arabinofuranosidase